MDTETNTNALELSDEEFMQMDPSEFDEPQVEENSEEVVAEQTDTTDTEEVAQEQPEPEVEEEEVSQPDEDTQQEHEPESNSDEPTTLDTEEGTDDTDGDTQETSETDFQGAYKRIMSPFKANGKTMQVDNADDVIKLMQMGANYNKKMEEITPNLKLVKMLENNGLLDEAKLNNLIDLSKKNPAAISKLIKESGIDPLDIDTDKEVEYTPNQYGVTDKEYKLDQALESIKSSETFSKTLDVMSKQWDESSRAKVTDHPEIIGIIDAHMQNGVYDQVMSVIDKEKALGRLTGVSDVDAYQQAAEYLYSQGHLVTGETRTAPPTSDSVSSSTKAKADAEAIQKRKAAAPTKSSAATSKPSNDFLGLSDEDFMKKYA